MSRRIILGKGLMNLYDQIVLGNCEFEIHKRISFESASAYSHIELLVFAVSFFQVPANQ